MRSLLFTLSAAALLAPTFRAAAADAPVSSAFVAVQNDAARLDIARHGGALVSFVLNAAPVNPLAWKVAGADMPENNKAGAPFQGHFLCVGRWGGPTPGEKAAGIPHNGEPANGWWDATASGPRQVTMTATAKLERWQVTRTVALSPRDPVATVRETFTNLLPLGRYTAFVQHATMGGAFLEPGTIVSTNAGEGFNQALAAESLTAQAYRWPAGVADAEGKRIDLTRSDSGVGYVSTHVIDGPWGWATVATPAQGVLIGYVWKTAEYPWLHVWNGLKDGRLWAKGVEFGTTALGDTVSPERRMTATFHGRTNVCFVDANARVTKTYRCFLVRIPATYRATRAIACTDDALDLTLDVGGRDTHVTLSSR